MTRKLHNTLMAVIASSSLLIVGVIASAPVTTEFGASSIASLPLSLDTQAFDLQAEPAASGLDRPDQTEAAPIQQARAVRHRRQSLAMPFYSFAPRS